MPPLRLLFGLALFLALLLVSLLVSLRLVLMPTFASQNTPLENVANSDDHASVWLDRMSHAFKEENYRGVLIYGDNQHWETLQITHAVMDGVEYERLLHLNGEPREVIRKGHDITCIHPGQHAVRLGNHQNPLANEFSHQTDGLDAYYQLSTVAGERIAGRQTQQIIIAPQDPHRYGYRLWLDKQSALLLRSDLVDAQGQVLERFQFAEIDIGTALLAHDFEPQSRGHRMAAHITRNTNPLTHVASAWRLNWVPRGFMQTGNTLLAGSGQTTLMYSDGLAAFTLFVESAADESRMPRLQQQWGATAAVVRYIGTQSGKYRITVVGEVPLITAEKIAASVMSP